MRAASDSVCRVGTASASGRRVAVAQPAASHAPSTCTRPKSTALKSSRRCSAGGFQLHVGSATTVAGVAARPQRDDVQQKQRRGTHVCAAASPAAEKAAAVLAGSAAELPISAVLDEIIGTLEKSTGLVLQARALP